MQLVPVTLHSLSWLSLFGHSRGLLGWFQSLTTLVFTAIGYRRYMIENYCIIPIRRAWRVKISKRGRVYWSHYFAHVLRLNWCHIGLETYQWDCQGWWLESKISVICGQRTNLRLTGMQLILKNRLVICVQRTNKRRTGMQPILKK